MKTRILSMMLALLMAFGSFGVFCTVPGIVEAAESTVADDETTGGTTGDTTGGTTGDPTITEEPYVAIVAAALRTNYESAQDKLDSDENMRLAAKYGVYELYVNDYTAEVAVKDTTTGQILLSNPYKIENTDTVTVSDSTRAELLSQIVLTFLENGSQKVYNSYTEAAARGQIKVKNIKQGIRIEYTLGREDANYLAPGSITMDRMVSEILSVMAPGLESYAYKDLLAMARDLPYHMMQFLSYYTPLDPFEVDENGNRILDDNAYNAMLKAFPILQKLGKGIYVRSSSTARDKRMLENYIKTYCPNYTYEEMEKDHAETQYTSDELDPPLFKLALEYTLTDEGLTIRLPANGIRFDYSLFQLESVSLLQYFGAGDLSQEGYLFYPDGGGAILYYEDLALKTTNLIKGQVYGLDYAYHQITGKPVEAIRVPVFGAVNTYTDTTTIEDEEGNPIETITTTSQSGYFAILEEGDAMAQITAAWGGSRHRFGSVYTTFYPRPKDTYDLGGTGSVGSSGSGSTWTVESSRKYTGSYKLRIYMLSDRHTESEGKAFAPTYVGMADAYRYYLTEVAGVLSALTVADKENIPLYIESFGTVPDTERILSIPVDVDVPLTTFDDVKQMYKDLSDNGISNVQFKLTGFANGGMYYTYPNRLKWMNEVGGDSGFASLLDEAKSKGFGVYPDFDFMYVTNRELFDGIDLKYAAARTIDNRYSSRRVYDATYQEFATFFEICVTPSMIEEYYAKFAGKFMSFDPIGISVGTLGSDLNSDFGDKSPTNRDEAKKIITSIFKQLHKDYNGSVMTSGGNIYAVAYTEHLLNAALDSSRFASASRSIPFIGMVLHGHVNFAGSPINMAGNVNYQVLKAIENGASVYFTLSYANTSLLKEYTDLSQYYAVNYEIWAGKFDENGNLVERGELFEVYDRVNDAIGTLQTKKIVDHQFLIGERVPTESELAKDESAYQAAWDAAVALATTAAQKQQLADYRAAFAKGEMSAGEIIDAVADDEAILAALEASGALVPTTTESEATAGDEYEKTKYSLDDGMIVMVSYEGGTTFVLNYNIYAVQVRLNGTVYTIAPYDYATVTL